MYASAEVFGENGKYKHPLGMDCKDKKQPPFTCHGLHILKVYWRIFVSLSAANTGTAKDNKEKDGSQTGIKKGLPL